MNRQAEMPACINLGGNMNFDNKLITLIIISFNIFCYSQFSGGSGTEENPYHIATPDDLNNIRYYLTSSFIQTADIDLGVAPWNEGEGWDPIGDYDWSNPNLSFRGNYDGNGYSILNLCINRTIGSDLGLFASTQETKIQNIYLKNVLIVSNGTAIGGITGISSNSDNMLKCNVEGSVKGDSEIGLLAGFFVGTSIKDCHVKGEIYSYGNYIGGLVGLCGADSVINCSAEVTITNNQPKNNNLFKVGGLIGFSDETKLIRDCYSKINIVAQNGNLVGGLIGSLSTSFNNVLLMDCFSEGFVYLNTDSIASGFGGLIAGVSGQSNFGVISMIKNCYSSVDVTGNDIVGGFIGRAIENVNIENCYSSGQVNGNTNVGGFIGNIEDPASVTVTNSYWDMETSGIDSSAAGEGRTTAEMTLPYSGNTYVGWNFINVWRDDTANQNNGYPTFLWVSGIEEAEDYILPETSRLYQNYPNPFNPVTQIKFDLAKAGIVKLSVYNINGQKVAELLNGIQNAGIHTIEFDGSNLNSGVYYYTLKTDGNILIRKMLIVK